MIVLACYHCAPSQDDIHHLALYGQQVANNRDKTDIELLIALKSNQSKPETMVEGHPLRYINENELLEDLVDFSDYYDRL